MLQVRRFVADFRHTTLDEVQPETTLPYDLGIDGDEAADLLLAFESAFSVDLSGFRYHEHFGDEGVPLRVGLVLIPLAVAVGELWSWRWWAGTALVVAAAAAQMVRWRKGFAHPLRVRDLAQAAVAKRWVYPYPPAGDV